MCFKGGPLIMKMKRMLVLILMICLLCSSGYLAFGVPPDIIHEMVVTITPQDDGYLNIHYSLDYEAATDFPEDIQYLEVGVANTDFTLLDYSPDTLIEDAYGTTQNGAFVHLDFKKLPKAGDRFTLEFTVKQGSMYNKSGQNDVSFQFVPGWFDFAIIKELQVIVETDGLNNVVVMPTPDKWSDSKAIWITKNLEANEKAEKISVLNSRSSGFSEDNAYQDQPNNYNEDYAPNYNDNPRTSSSFSFGRIILFIFVLIFIASLLGGRRNRYRAGRYGGGYWGPPPPRHRSFWGPPPPPPGGFGGRPPRGFGGGGFGGGRSSGGSSGRSSGRSSGGGGRSCACACACAGGGRVGCSERGYQVLHWLIKNKETSC